MSHPDGRRIWIGWLGNWEYAGNVPTSPWRGIQSIPRVLRLMKFPQGIRLVQEPIAELRSLRGRHVTMSDQSFEAASRILHSEGMKGDTLEIEATIDPGKAKSFGFEVRKGGDQQTMIGIDRLKSELFVDRTRSGDTSFNPGFSGRQTAPLKIAEGKPIKLHIFVDRCSVEVFASHGDRVMSELIFPSLSSQDIRLYSRGGGAKIVKLDLWNLKLAWQE